MNTRPSTLRPALAAAVISGFAVFVNGLAVRRFDDATVYTTAKNLIAGLVLVGLVVARMPPSPRRVPARTISSLSYIAVLGGAVPFVLFFEGLQRASSTNAAFIHKTLVIWVAIGATTLLGERITLHHAGAIGVLVIGHLVLVGGGPSEFGMGELMIAGATLLWASEVLVVRRVLGEVPADVGAAVRMGGGAVVLVAWLVSTGRVHALSSLDLTQVGWLCVTGLTLAGFVAAWYRALALAPAVDVTAMLVLGAVITGALNVVIRGVPISNSDPIGYGLLIAGAIMIVRASGSTAIERMAA